MVCNKQIRTIRWTLAANWRKVGLHNTIHYRDLPGNVTTSENWLDPVFGEVNGYHSVDLNVSGFGPRRS